jgi:hypothetical protein
LALFNFSWKNNMQRHLKAPAPQPAPIPTLSVEEEAILADEHSEASQALDQATAAADHITDVADVANDAVQVVDITPQCGQVEAELVEAVGDMAVAGSDADPADVISLPMPAEGGEPTPEGLSVEGIASTLKSIWDAIVTAIKNMWVGFKHWMTTYFSTLEQNKKHAEKLIERLSGMKGYLANDGAMVTSSMTDIFHYSGKSFLDLFNTAGRQEQDFNNYVLETTKNQHGLMIPIGDGLAQAYGAYNGDEMSDIGQVVDVLSRHFADYMKRLDLHPGKGDKWETKAIAQMKVTAAGYSDKITDPAQSVETKIAMLSKIRFSVDQDTSFGSNKIVSMKLDVTPDKLLEYVKERLAFINELIKFKADQFKALEDKAGAVQNACDAMLKRIKEDNKEGTSFAKRMMPLTTAYAQWATQPTGKLLNVAARHNKFWLSLFEMATNNFHEA